MVSADVHVEKGTGELTKASDYQVAPCLFIA